ncbi:MAG: ribulose-phosphate 3-epimerase [Candidatus Pacebacteria bacterium]|nr:ribulose-phosphate 3-epimerase [Candidatus Paceibacterota bacterium]
MNITPAIIPKSYEDLRQKISLVKDFSHSVQIDITDGVFVPSTSWPYSDSVWSEGIFLDMPFCNECNFEFDLMIQNPEKTINDWILEGASRIVIHVESTDNLEQLISDIKGKNVGVGLAFNIETSFDLYAHLLDKIDFIQLMGIEKIGFQGQPFSEKIFEKIADLRKRKPDVIISIDGGVNLENAKRLKEAGVSRVVAGSTIFESDNIEKVIEQFKEI